MNSLILVNTWDFDPPSSCAVVTFMVFGLIVFPLCTLRSQMRYCQKSSGSSMMFSGLFLLIVMIPEFNVGDVNFYQGLGEYVKVILQWSSHHVFHRRIHIFLPHCFPCPVIVYQLCECFNEYVTYDEYGHRDHQIGLSLLLDEGNQLLLEEGLCFWIYLLNYFGLDTCFWLF